MGSPAHRLGYHDVSRALVVGIAVVLLGLAAGLAWVLVLRPTPAGGTVGPDGAPVVDLPVDRVLARTADGRDALASVTLRMRESGTPAQLRAVAARTPTPIVDEDAAAVRRQPTPPDPASAENRVREQVAAAVSQLGYEQAAGEGGKVLLRQTIRDAVNQALPGQPVVGVYVREYLVK